MNRMLGMTLMVWVLLFALNVGSYTMVLQPERYIYIVVWEDTYEFYD